MAKFGENCCKALLQVTRLCFRLQGFSYKLTRLSIRMEKTSSTCQLVNSSTKNLRTQKLKII